MFDDLEDDDSYDIYRNSWYFDPSIGDWVYGDPYSLPEPVNEYPE